MCAMRDSVCRRSVTSSWVLIRYCGSPASSSTVARRVRNSRKPSLVLIGCSSLSTPRFLIAASSRLTISLASFGLKISVAVRPVASSRRRLRMVSALRLASRYRPSLTRSTIRATGILSTTSSKLLGIFEFQGQRFVPGGILEQCDQEFRLILVVAGDHAVAGDGARLGADFDRQFAAELAVRRRDRAAVGGF